MTRHIPVVTEPCCQLQRFFLSNMFLFYLVFPCIYVSRVLSAILPAIWSLSIILISFQCVTLRMCLRVCAPTPRTCCVAAMLESPAGITGEFLCLLPGMDVCFLAPCLLILCSPLPSPGCHADCSSFLRGHVGHGPSKSCLSEGIECLITSKLPGEKPPCLRIVQPFSPSTAYDLWASRAAVERPKSIWSLTACVTLQDFFVSALGNVTTRYLLCWPLRVPVIRKLVSFALGCFLQLFHFLCCASKIPVILTLQWILLLFVPSSAPTLSLDFLGSVFTPSSW